jgi:hypothetical protein
MYRDHKIPKIVNENAYILCISGRNRRDHKIPKIVNENAYILCISGRNRSKPKQKCS